MRKIALVFSGQGSQYVGMGKELYENFDCVKALYDDASNTFESDIAALSFNGPIEDLSKTINTQPAILTHSIACLLVLQENGIKADAVCGFSLGEYSALVASEVISFKDCLKLVQTRATLMENAVKDVDSTMYAVVGLTYDEVLDVIKDEAQICNYNTKTQIVIGGEKSKLEAVVKRFSEDVKVVELNVSGAFHSSVLDNASNQFKQAIDECQLNKPNTKVLSNYTGTYYESIDSDTLSKQMNNTVRFYDNIQVLLNDGYDTFIELGPGRVISSFVKSIGRELGVKPLVLNVEDLKSLEKVLKKLEE